MTRTEPENAFRTFHLQHPHHKALYHDLRRHVNLLGEDVLFVVLHPHVSQELMRYIQWLQNENIVWAYNPRLGYDFPRRLLLQAIYNNWPQRVADLDRGDPQASRQWIRTWELRNVALSGMTNHMLRSFITTDDFLHVFVFSYIVNALAGMIGDVRPPERPTLFLLPPAIAATIRPPTTVDDWFRRRKEPPPVAFGRRQMVLFQAAGAGICRETDAMREGKQRKTERHPNLPPDPPPPPPRGSGGGGPGGGGGGPSGLAPPVPAGT